MRIADIWKQKTDVDDFYFDEFWSKTDIKQFCILFAIWFWSIGITFISGVFEFWDGK